MCAVVFLLEVRIFKEVSMKQTASYLTEIFRSHPILSITILCQLLAISYINLFCLQDYLGYDSSVVFLLAKEIWKQKSFVPENFVFQSGLFLDNPTVFAAPLYGLLGDVFVAHGIADLFVLILMMMVMSGLLQRMNVSLRAKLLFFICFLTPYIGASDTSNPIGYSYSTFFIAAFYSFRIFIILFIWLLFIDWDANEKQNKKKLLAMSALCLSLCVLTGSGNGYFVLVFGVAPCLFFYLVRCLKMKSYISRTYAGVVFLFLSAVAIIAGKMISKHILHFEGLDDRTVLISLPDFWSNLSSIFLGYLKLLSALPSWGKNDRVVSVSGIFYASRFVLAAIFLIGGIITLLRTWQKSFDSAKGVISCGLIANVLVLALVNSRYGDPIFEERYLIVSFISLLMLFSLWSDFVFKSDNPPLRVGLVLLLLSSVVITNISSYKFLNNSKNDHAIYDAVSDAVRQIGKVAYATNSVKIMTRNIKAYDDEVIYKLAVDSKMTSPHHWGDYTYYDENAEYAGATALITTAEDFNKLPKYLKNEYSFVTKIEGTNIQIYKSANNPIDFATGITNSKKNIDFPYTRWMCIAGFSQIDENDGTLVTDGTEGFVIWGPYTPAREGKYNFKVNYQVLNVPAGIGNVGYFDVAVNMSPIRNIKLDINKTSVTIPDVILNGGGQLEYRVYEYKGVILKVKSFEIERIDP